MKSERTARIILFILLAASGFVGTLALAPSLNAPSLFAQFSGGNSDTIEIHARMPENGGWSVETIHAQVGQPVHLRMTSDDVLHSFAIGQSDQKPVDILPGEWSETTLVFDKPGRYTYYCTRWCGRNHWRMRGIIEVTNANAVTAAVTPPDSQNEKPLYLRLGLKVDAPHLAEDVPAAPPDAKRGAALLEQLSGKLSAGTLDRQTYLESSPAGLWKRLRAETALSDRSDSDLWDIVAAVWARQTSPQALERASQLYTTNCAACHGETGKGDGVMVEGLPRFDPSQAHTGASGSAMYSSMDMSGQMADSPMQLSAPPDLTNPHTTLGAPPALLEGKMLRGGMGTGMPYWGPIFNQDDMDAIIAYLYIFAMQAK